APTNPLVANHRVSGTPTLPAAASIRFAASAAIAIGRTAPLSIRDLRWMRPIRVTDGAVELRVVVRPRGDALETGLHGDRDECARATIAPHAEVAAETLDITAIVDRCTRIVSRDELYRAFTQGGVEYRGEYRALTQVRHGVGEALGLLAPAGSAQVG